MSKLTKNALAYQLHQPLLCGLMVALTPFVSIYGHKYGYTPDLHMASWLQIVVLVIGIGYCFSLLGSKKKHPESIAKWTIQEHYLLPLFLLIVWMGLSIIWAQAKFLAVLQFVDWFLGAIFLLLIQQIIKAEKDFRLLGFFLFASCLLIALVGIAQYLFDFKGILQVASPGSTFSNKNRAAQYVVVTWPFGVLLFLYTKGAKQYIYSVAIAVVLAYLFYTFTRAAWLSVIVQCVMMLIGYQIWKKQQGTTKKRINIKAVAVGLGLFIVLIALSSQGLNFNNIIEAGGEFNSIFSEVAKSSTGLRLIMWQNSIEMIKDHWLLGVGLGNWLVEYPVYHQRVVEDFFMNLSSQHNHAHNDLIEFVAELGVIGLVLIIWFVVRLIKSLSKLIKGNNGIYALVATTAIIGILVDALFSFPLQKSVIILLVMVPLGMLSALNEQSVATYEQKKIKVTRMGVSIGCVMFLTATILAVIYHYNAYMAELHKRLAVRAAHKQNFTLVLEHAQKSINFNPWQATILNTLAIAHQQVGNMPKALEVLEHSFKSQPHSLYNLYNAADFALKLKQYDKARQHLSHYVEIRPNDFRAQFIYANLLYYIFKDKLSTRQHLMIAKRVAEEANNKPQISEVDAFLKKL